MTLVTEISLITKYGGILTKQIKLDASGKLQSDGSQCKMSRGTATRLPLSNIGELAAAIERLDDNQALALGRLRRNHGDCVTVLAETLLDKHQGIARTKENFVYETGQPGFVLLDYDMKAMPSHVAERMNVFGKYEDAVSSVLPEIKNTARVERASTSAGLYRVDTREEYPTSGGRHLYIQVKDGADSERFLKTLHKRMVLNGLGWFMIGRAGQLLERSIIDRSVGSPERLVFEGGPAVEPPLAQDAEARRPVVIDGDIMDTLAAIPPLTIADTSRYDTIIAQLKREIKPEADKVRKKYVEEQAAKLVAKHGMSYKEALRIIERQVDDRVLTGAIELVFDDPELSGVTVADILADPDKYVGETLADPLDGIEYGRCKARIIRRDDGTLYVHSLAHGCHTIFDLKFDFAAVQKMLAEASDDNEAAELWVRMALTADLTKLQIQRLRDKIAKDHGIGARLLNNMLNEARADEAVARKREEVERRLSECTDPRPVIDVPDPNAERLPVMQMLDQILGESKKAIPPARNLDGDLATVAMRSHPGLHLLVNASEKKQQAPPQMLIVTMSESEASDAIEQHVKCQNWAGEAAYIGAPFVRHYMNRQESTLPKLYGVSTLPIVTADGRVLTGEGLDHRSGIVFQIPSGLTLPTREQCTDNEIAKAMDFLCNEWLVDVATDYAGKCVLIACTMSIIERMMFPERPAFFVTAGMRASGKTTAMQMVAMAGLGMRVSAARWSHQEEERRKSLFSYLMTGVPFLGWDNIPSGYSISCPSIESALTTDTYSDRKLGESIVPTAYAYTIQTFTGNNISARGDLSSRVLTVRLNVDRTDPENRTFRHHNIDKWTIDNRNQILAALYTIMLGNSRFEKVEHKPAETRFKEWWHLIAAPLEHAAKQHARWEQERVHGLVADAPEFPAKEICFRTMFLEGEAEDEQALAIGEVLTILQKNYPQCARVDAKAKVDGITAKDIAMKIDEFMSNDAADLREAIEAATYRFDNGRITSKMVAKRLGALKDRPVVVERDIGQDKIRKDQLTLRYEQLSTKGGKFFVEGLMPKGETPQPPY